MKTYVRKDRVKIRFNDFTYNTKYTILEESKDKQELIKIAKKYNVHYPSYDIAIFKGLYAVVDNFDLNGCRIEKEEVAKALSTLSGKAVTFDHGLHKICGYWLEARLEGDYIISYGVFWKSRFQKEYEYIMSKFKNDEIKISKEAWGFRYYYEDGTYDLRDIEFCGGALLIVTSPAHPQCKVLEFASIVNEKIIECPYCGKEFDYNKQLDYTTNSRKCPYCNALINENGDLLKVPQIIDFSLKCPSPCYSSNWEIQERKEDRVILKCLSCFRTYEVEFDSKPKESKIKLDVINLKKINCLQCGYEISLATFFSNKNYEVVCDRCGLKFPYHIVEGKRRIKKIRELSSSKNGGDAMWKKILAIVREESKKLTYKERKALKDSDFALVLEVPKKKGEGKKKIRMFPIHDEEHVRNALARLGQEKVQETLKELKVDPEKVKQKILKKAEELKMKDLLKKYEKSSALYKEGIKKLAKRVIELSARLKEYEETLLGYEQELATVNENKVFEVSALKAEIEKKEKEYKQKLDKEVERKMEISRRREELGEFAKDLSDEDLLDDLKFENACLKKQLELSSKHTDTDLVVGSKKPKIDEVVEKVNELWLKRKNV